MRCLLESSRVLSIFVALAMIVPSSGSGVQVWAQGQPNTSLPIAGLTTSLGSLHPDGTQQVQSVVHVAVGMPSRVAYPACVGSGAPNSAATCINVCVRLPPGSEVTEIEGLAGERGTNWKPCAIGSCFGQRADITKAMFDPSGPTKEQVFGMDRVCWVFRNWHPTSARTAILLTTFRAPPPETWREVAVNYPWRVLQSKIEQVIGPNPVDCGQHRDTRGWAASSGKPSDDTTALAASLACAQGASAEKTPFWTAKELRGIDSSSVYGLLGQRDGSIYVFSASLGGSDKLSVTRCLVPEVQLKGGRQVFACAR